MRCTFEIMFCAFNICDVLNQIRDWNSSLNKLGWTVIAGIKLEEIVNMLDRMRRHLLGSYIKL
jgi:hypothetical protein